MITNYGFFSVNVKPVVPLNFVENIKLCKIQKFGTSPEPLKGSDYH